MSAPMMLPSPAPAPPPPKQIVPYSNQTAVNNASLKIGLPQSKKGKGGTSSFKRNAGRKSERSNKGMRINKSLSV